MNEIKKQLKKPPSSRSLVHYFCGHAWLRYFDSDCAAVVGNQESIFSICRLGMSIDTGYILLGFLVGIYPFMQFFSHANFRNKF